MLKRVLGELGWGFAVVLALITGALYMEVQDQREYIHQYDQQLTNLNQETANLRERLKAVENTADIAPEQRKSESEAVSNDENTGPASVDLVPEARSNEIDAPLES